MFDIGFAELLIIAVVGLVVIGPERLPGAVRTAAKFLGRAKRTYGNLRRDLEREIGADEIRRELYNEAILEELKQTKQQLNNTMNWNADGTQQPQMTANTGATEDKEQEDAAHPNGRAPKDTSSS